jgi:TatD DNase family protein
VVSHPDETPDALARVADGRYAWATAGVHPHEAGRATDEALLRVRELAADARVVAVGECGLDFHYDFAPRDAQLRVFSAQIEVAEATGLPLVVHCREADEEMTRVMRELPRGVRGVLHCFSGGERLLETALSAGWLVSVTGLVSFKRFDGAGWLRSVPEDRLMVETDAPYLAPVPHRGQRNEPAFVRLVAEAVALHREEPLEKVVAYTGANANRFFGLEDGAARTHPHQPPHAVP